VIADFRVRQHPGCDRQIKARQEEEKWAI